MKAVCDIVRCGRIPFICFDLAGGANLNGSEILIGGKGGQLDFLVHRRLREARPAGRHGAECDQCGEPDEQLHQPGLRRGLAFGRRHPARHAGAHVARPRRRSRNGCAIAARSENDTGNNPHNPMYGILKTGADGELLGLIGSQASDSGGNSMAPPR